MPLRMCEKCSNPKPLAQYAGQTIKVEGEKHEKMKAMEAKKVYVQDGGGWRRSDSTISITRCRETMATKRTVTRTISTNGTVVGLNKRRGTTIRFA